MQYITHEAFYKKNNNFVVINSHPGAWFGLPDFGVTEAIGSLIGTGRTPQGGSNLLGQQRAAAPTTKPASIPTGIAVAQGSGYKSGGGGSTSSAQIPNINPGYDAAAQAARDEAARREAEYRSAINSGYDDYESRLHGLESSYGSARDEDVNSAAKVYDKIFGGLNDQKQINLDKLEANRGEVQSRQDSSIKALKQNLGETVRGMSMQLGAMGAGDTSASNVMVPYAYTKLAGVQEGSIRGQANQQLFQIDQDEKDTQMEFSKMWTQTETEKEQQLQSIRNYYGDAIRNVQSALASAPVERQQQLANLSLGLLNEAKSRLSTIEAQDRQQKANLQTWGMQRMSQLNDMRLQLAGNANFSPQDITFNELKMAGIDPASGSSVDQSFNPMALAQKRRDDYLSR